MGWGGTPGTGACGGSTSQNISQDPNLVIYFSVLLILVIIVHGEVFHNFWKIFIEIFLCFFHRFLKIAANSSVFEQGIFSLHQNGVEFHQKINGTLFVKVVRHQRALCGIKGHA